MSGLENLLYIEVRGIIGRNKLLDLKEEFLIFPKDPIRIYKAIISSIENSTIKRLKVKL